MKKNETTNTPINKGHFDLDTEKRIAEFEEKRASGWIEKKQYFKYRKEWSEFPKNKIIREYPLQVDLELSSACNLKCPMCYTITDEFKSKVKRQYMDTNLAKKVIDEVSNKVYALRLSWRGESTLHTDFIKIIKYAKDKGIQEVSFLTNGGKLTLDFFKKIQEAGVDWITVSADGTDEVYEGIRKPLKFKETVQKLKDMNLYKKEHDLLKPVIKVQTIWPAIRRNPTEYYEIFSEVSDLVSYNPIIDYLNNDDENQIVYEDKFSCPQLYERVFVSSTGEVVLCNGDENGEFIIGNANNETIHDIWHSEKLNKIRETHKKIDEFKKMSICNRCFYPRKMIPNEPAKVGDRDILVENYINRKQEIGK